jgi:hypothetical protein
MLNALLHKQRISVDFKTGAIKAAWKEAAILDAEGDLFQVVFQTRIASNASGEVPIVRGGSDLLGLSFEALTAEALFCIV